MLTIGTWLVCSTDMKLDREAIKRFLTKEYNNVHQ